MKHARAVLLLLALSAGAAPCTAQSVGPPPPPPPPPAAEYDPKSWKQFVSEEGRFSALFPGTPAKRVMPAGGSDITTYTLNTFAEYGVMYMDLPGPVTEPAQVKAVLDGGRDEGLRSVNGRLLEEKEITLGGYAGRHHKVLAGNGSNIWSRMYVVGARAYVLSFIVYSKDAPAHILKFNEETAAKFLDSFKLIPAGDAP